VETVAAACGDGRGRDAGEAIACGLMDEIVGPQRASVRALPGFG